MPTKEVTYSKDKAVVVRVYAEKPGKKRSSSIQQHHRHRHRHHLHYHLHHTCRQEVVHGPASNGYDRRAGLLMYSNQLRQSAREVSSSTSLLPKSANNYLQPPPTKMTPSKKKPKFAGRPACFGNWKPLIPSFLRSWCNVQNKKKKKKQVHGGFSGKGMRILQVRRGRSFITNMFSTTRKRA